MAPADQSEQFHCLKRELHQTIIAGIDMSRLDSMGQEELRQEIPWTSPNSAKRSGR